MTDHYNTDILAMSLFLKDVKILTVTLLEGGRERGKKRVSIFTICKKTVSIFTRCKKTCQYFKPDVKTQYFYHM
jgi:hypothetical protein